MKNSMAGKQSSSSSTTSEDKISSSNSSVSHKNKKNKLQLSKPQTANTTKNVRIGLPKPKKPTNVEVIDLETDSPSPAPKLSQIARLYEAKLQKIERIKPRPATSTLVTKFFEQHAETKDDDSDFDSRSVPLTLSPPVSTSKPKKKRTSRAVKKGIGENFPDIRKLVNPNYSGNKKRPASSQEPLRQSQDFNSTTDDIKRIRVTLEQYGFKGARNYDDEYDFTALFGPSTNAKRKKIRPTLLMKKDRKEQERILEEKVSQLLAEEYKENVAVPISKQLKYETVSFFLENYLAETPDVFYINSNGDAITECMESYYKSGLFPISDVKAGYLLKDWAAIAGRDRSMSPERRETTEVTNEEEPVPMEVDQELNIDEDEEPVLLSLKNSSVSVNQVDLDNIQSRLIQASSSLNGSCEDLFADYDNDIVCTETRSKEEEEGECDF